MAYSDRACRATHVSCTGDLEKSALLSSFLFLFFSFYVVLAYYFYKRQRREEKENNFKNCCCFPCLIWFDHRKMVLRSKRQEKPDTKGLPVWRRSHPRHSSAGRAIWPQAGQRPHLREGCRSEDRRLSSPPLLIPLGNKQNELQLLFCFCCIIFSDRMQLTLM